MKKINILLVLLVALQLSSCSDLCDCFHGTGDVITEERALGNISGIHLANNVDVIIYESNFSKIRVTAGDKLIKDVKYNFI